MEGKIATLETWCVALQLALPLAPALCVVGVAACVCHAAHLQGGLASAHCTCPPPGPTCCAHRDFCNDKDCSPDNANCCSKNKEVHKDEDGSGFLLDIETHALKSVWDYDDGHNWLVAPAHYRM